MSGIPAPHVSTTAIVAVVALIAGIAAVGAVSALVLWTRRRAATATAIQQSIVAALERDPALADLSLRLAARQEWNGETVLKVAGVVPSPWHRYAVIRTVQRALARTYRSARIIDHIAIEPRSAIPRRRAS